MTLCTRKARTRGTVARGSQKMRVRPEDIALEMLREKFTPRVLHHDADFLIGTMSDEDHAVFLENIAAFERG